MNAENFYEYIKEPARLHQISYQELKSLVLQYPYAQNLRYLLLQKSLLDGHAEFDKNLNAAAALSPDRKHLYTQLKELRQLEIQDEPFTLEEDFLELRDLEAFEEPLQDVTLSAESQSSALNFDPDVPKSPAPILDFSTEPEPVEPMKPASFENQNEVPRVGIEEPKDTQIPSPPSASEDEIPTELMRMQETNLPHSPAPWSPSQRLFDLLFGFGSLLSRFSIHQIASTLPSAPDSLTPQFIHEEPIDKILAAPKPTVKQSAEMNVETNTGTPSPAPKSSFSSWVKQFQSPQTNLRLDSIMESSRPKPVKTKKRKQPKKGNRAETLAQRSLRENHDLASETLAMILEKQGHREKAIRMYERLGLIFPEKSSFFAEKIKNLKKQ
ncbi:MAG: hypothetical protein AAGH79_13270 [Bacteroidota bacterium]